MTTKASHAPPSDRQTLSRRDLLKRTATFTGLALLTACGAAPAAPTTTGSTTEENPTSAPAAAAPTAAPTAPPEPTTAPPPEKAVVIRFSSVGWGGWLAEPWQTLVSRFNDSQASVQIPGGYEDIAEGYQKVMAQAAGGVAADVYMFETKQMQSFAARGFFSPLDELVKASTTIKEADYFVEDWKEMFWGGHQTLIPFDNSPAMMWYNKAVFDKAGVEYPPDQYGEWTWDDFLATTQKLTSGEGAERVYGWAGDRSWTYLLNWIWSNGGNLLNEERTECVIDMPETVEALQWAADLVTKHQVQPVAAALGDSGNNGLFYNNRAGIAQRGTWWAIDLKAQPDLKWNVAPVPDGPAGAFVRNPLDAWGIWTGSQQREGAWEFIEFLSQDESLVELTKAGLSVSKMSVMNSDAFLKQDPADVDWYLFADALNGHTKPHPDTAIYAEMNNLLTPEWHAVIDGASTVQQFVTNVKEPINKLLAECIAKGDCIGPAPAS